MKIEHLTMVLVVIIIILIISAFYSPEVPEIKKEEPRFVIVEEKEEPKQIIEEVKAEPKEAVIEVKRGFFDPKEITIEEGTKVIWINEDDRWNMGAESSTPRYFYGDTFFPGGNYSFVFNEAGEYDYYDVIFYSTMKGKIIVIEEEKTPLTGSVIEVPSYGNRVTGALILIAIVALLSIHLLFYYERKH